MNAASFTPFLISLAASGIRPTIRDYQRISLALQTGEAWTITRLRDVLLALLAKDEDQQEIFLRRFDGFFTLEPGAEKAFAEVDIGRVLAELRQLAEDKPVTPKPQPFLSKYKKGLVSQSSEAKGKLGLGVALAVVLLIGVIVVWRFHSMPRGSVPVVSLHPSELHFGHIGMGTFGNGKITLMNVGTDSLYIDSLSITGPHAGHFETAENYSNRILLPNNSLTRGLENPRRYRRHSIVCHAALRLLSLAVSQDSRRQTSGLE
jgi:hypothetical protein